MLKDLGREKPELLKDVLINQRKNMKEKHLNQFKREVGFLRSVQHPNLAVCFGGVDSICCMVTEFAPKGDLRSFIKNTNLNWSHVKKIATNIAQVFITFLI